MDSNRMNPTVADSAGTFGSIAIGAEIAKAALLDQSGCSQRSQAEGNGRSVQARYL
jgi:hypothetical protein